MGTQEAGGIGRALTRRGLIAGAAAMVAGLAATRATQPVRAAVTDTSFTASGGTLTAFSNGAGYNVGVNVSGSLVGITGASTSGIGVEGTSNSNYGVSGVSSTNHAIHGSLLTFGNGFAGVFGSGDGNGTFGVLGDGNNGTANTGGVGVQGQSAQFGVVGKVNNAPNSIAVYGNNQSTGSNPIGVYGLANKGTGVFGQTNAASQYGVLGTTTVANSTAVAGIANTNGSSAFSGGTTNPNAFAAFFQGTTVVQGNFAVTGTKSAVIQHPRTGDHRLVYCVESPESYFEDFGKGTLAGGRAAVTLDADFAALIHTDDYHVFLTEYDGHNNLCVANRTASGFEVQAATPTASGAFSWRVVGKRADVKSERLGKFTLPNLPLPNPAAFKAPETPTPAVPPKRP